MGDLKGKVIIDTSQAEAAVDKLGKKVAEASKNWKETISERFVAGVKSGSMPLSTYRSALKAGIIDQDNQVNLYNNSVGSMGLNQSKLGQYGFDVIKQGNPSLSSGIPHINLGGQDEIQGAKIAALMAEQAAGRAERDRVWAEERAKLRVANEAPVEETREAYSARVSGTPLEEMSPDDQRRAIAEGMIDAKGNFKGLGEEGVKTAEQISRAYITEQRKIGVAATRMGRDMLILGAALGAPIMGAIKSYAALELSMSKLGQAMKATNEYSDESLQAFKSQSVALMRTTGVGVAATLQDISYAKSLKMTNEQIQALLPRMADISVTLGIDMQTAFKAASLSLNGITTQMRRLGFYVSAGKDGIVTLDDILAATSGVAGAAAVAGETLAGSWNKVRESAKLLSASFGEQAAPAIKGLLDRVEEAINKFGEMDPAAKKANLALLSVAAGFAVASGAAFLLIGRVAAAKSALESLGLLSKLTSAYAAIGGFAGLAGIMALLAIAAAAYKDTVNPPEPATGEYKGPSRYAAQYAAIQTTLGNRGYAPGTLQGVREANARITNERGGGDVGARMIGMGIPKEAVAQPLSEAAVDAMQDLNNKILQLQGNGLQYSKELLKQEAAAMLAIAGVDSAKVAEYVKLKTASLTEAAQKDYKDSLYAATHSSLEVALYNEKERVQAMVKSGGATQGQADALYKLTSAKIIEEDAKKSSKGSQWKGISVEGTNVNSLMQYIGSIQGKMKPQEVVLSLKWDGKTIKVENGAANREEIRKMVESFMTQLINSKNLSYAN